jgi:adenosylcobinamide-phosphate synthase
VGTVGCGVLMSSLLAQRGLDDHVLEVAEALERGVVAGREAVAKIVGRDTGRLDEAAIARAAIESLAENFSDAVVAPAFWLALAGPPGGIAYKAINTADSMVGHRSERYRAFGWAAARTDDLVNLPASRLSALWLVLAAALLPGASAWGAAAAVWRDARRHRSPNAGWPEAAMAGALGFRLAGPRTYDGVAVEDHWMGVGRADATVADIRSALRLYRTAAALQAGVLAAVVAAILLG